MPDSNPTRRVIPINPHIVGPREPKLRNVRQRQAADYPSVPQVYRDAARKLSSPLMIGPPICDELMAFVQHLFTEEEAGVVRHLRQFVGRSAAQVARAEHRPVEQVEPILRSLALRKRAITASGKGEKTRYKLMPIMPGIFEMVLIGEQPETMSPWHRRFAELFEALYETGYMLDYGSSNAGIIRYLPVGKVIEAHPMALPSDRMEIILDRYKVFAVGQCQCRMTMQVMGKGCGKPVGNCSIMGDWAAAGIERGWARQVSKQEMLAIKREAEDHGMVNWMMNVDSPKGQASCSCCGCCCHAMRGISEFSAPALSAPPHFLPRFDLARCTSCGLCARKCPMAAITVDTRTKTHQWQAARCIGCGLCVLACDKVRAISLEAVPDYKLPYKSWFALLLHTMPAKLTNAYDVWRHR
jgi:formate hydrogenlyase subunit 6/NADH:ubiquinone oxidoreductase subunit I